jgi:hypothetical protein
MTQAVEYIIYGIPQPEKFLEAYTDILTLITASMSVLIACIALIVAHRQNKKNDLHNRLMVTPSLSDDTHVDIEGCTYEYKIHNKGIGPAIIIDAAIYVDGEAIETKDPLVDAIEMILKGTNLRYGHQSIALGTYILPNEVIDVLSVATDEANTPMVIHAEVQRRAKLKIKYKSIYGDTYAFDSK